MAWVSIFLAEAVGIVLVELDMHCVRHHRPVVGGDDVGVLAPSTTWATGLHHALHVHDHGLDRAGGQDHLLLDEGACHRNAPAHQDLVAGAADAGQVDALGPGLLGQSQHLLVLGGEAERLRPAAARGHAR